MNSLRKQIYDYMGLVGDGGGGKGGMCIYRENI